MKHLHNLVRDLFPGFFIIAVFAAGEGEGHAGEQPRTGDPASIFAAALSKAGWTNDLNRIAVCQAISAEIPANAVVVAPGTDIQSVVSKNPPGTSFLLKAGVHRLQAIVPKDGMSFYGEMDSAGKLLTILSGSAVLNSAEKSDSLYRYSGQQHKGGRVAFYGGRIFTQKGWEGSSYVEDVFINDVPLKHVLSQNEVVSGTFYFDYNNDAIYIADNPAGKLVEVSTVHSAFSGSAKNVAIKRLIIEKYACSESGAVGGFGADGWLIEGNEVRHNHTTGIDLNNNCKARWNYAHHNGMIGIGVFEAKHRNKSKDEPRQHGNNNLIEYNESSYNNYAHFDYHNQAAGVKNLVGNKVTIRGNYVHHNDSRGIWLDVGTVETLIEDNLIVGNAHSGIVAELAYDTVIRNNVLVDNGKTGEREPGGNFGYQITIQNSDNTEVFGNRCEHHSSGCGVYILMQDRENGRTTSRTNVHHNDFYSDPGNRMAAIHCESKDPSITREFYAEGNNRFDYNKYHTGKGDTVFMRAWEKVSLKQFRDLGYELHGEVLHAK